MEEQREINSSVKDRLAKNLAELRKANKLTQSDLANKLNYSDKAISKWERGESVPDIDTLYILSKFYGVKIDAMLTEDDILKKKGLSKVQEHIIITLLSILVVWIIATIVFVIFQWVGINKAWLTFIYAIPASTIVWIVFNGIWGIKYITPIISSVLIWTSLVSVNLTITESNGFLLYFIAIPLQVCAILWFTWIILRMKNKNIFKREKK